MTQGKIVSPSNRYSCGSQAGLQHAAEAFSAAKALTYARPKSRILCLRLKGVGYTRLVRTIQSNLEWSPITTNEASRLRFGTTITEAPDFNAYYFATRVGLNATRRKHNYGDVETNENGRVVFI